MTCFAETFSTKNAQSSAMKNQPFSTYFSSLLYVYFLLLTFELFGSSVFLRLNPYGFDFKTYTWLIMRLNCIIVYSNPLVSKCCKTTYFYSNIYTFWGALHVKNSKPLKS